MKHISVIPDVDVGKSGGGDADGTSGGGGGDDGGGAVSFLLCTDLMHVSTFYVDQCVGNLYNFMTNSMLWTE